MQSYQLILYQLLSLCCLSAGQAWQCYGHYLCCDILDVDASGVDDLARTDGQMPDALLNIGECHGVSMIFLYGRLPSIQHIR